MQSQESWSDVPIVLLTCLGDSSEDIDFAGFAGLSLGASAPSIYSGTLAPTGNTYRLGGGGSSLNLANENALTGANNLRVSGPGMVIVSNTNDYTGTTTFRAAAAQACCRSRLRPRSW